MMAHHWLILIYLVLLMTGFNFLAHGSQDLYPTFLASQLGFTTSLVTATTVAANCGCLIGSTLIGYFSSFFGRRLSMIVALIVGAIAIPAYVLPRDTKIIGGAFFEQFFVAGAWGVIPIYLIELSPDKFRSLVVGTCYQLGNLISAGASTIQAAAGQRFPLQTSSKNSDKVVYDYGKVIGIFLACNYVLLLVVVFLGPEKKDNDETKDHSELQITIPEENKSTSTK
jgi:SHS family lactate transporter-like MFS transporter